MTRANPSAYRLAYIDNLRWSAISMVVVMHAAVTYSPFGSWYYREHPPLTLWNTIAFAAYQSLQHAVSMGLLFGIAGFFAASAVARKGVGGFLRERLARLGLPLVVYSLLIGPVTEYYLAGSWHARPYRGFVEAWWWHATSGRLLDESGPLWFCLVLLLFSGTFGLLCLIRPVRSAPSRPPVTGVVLAYATVMTAATFAVGVAFPTAGTVLNVDVHDVPQYPFMFAAGVAAWRGDWLGGISPSAGRRWLWCGLAVSGVLWAALVGCGGALQGALPAYGGGWHWQAAGMDAWRSWTCLSLSLGLLTLYRDCFDAQNRVTRFLTQNAFGVYVLHAPVLVAITRVLHETAMPTDLKVLLASLTAIISTFALVGFGARRVPGCRFIR